MFTKKSALVISILSVTALSACNSGPRYNVHPELENADYWQRSSASSALYQRGPKAQQMLHNDIADCTVEIKELQNVGAIRRAVPPNYYKGNSMDNRTESQKDLDEWDSPERDGYLYAEHLEYSDFETCMIHKGWERLEYLPYDDAEKARINYIKNTGQEKKKRKKYGKRENVTTLHTHYQKPDPYKDLNE